MSTQVKDQTMVAIEKLGQIANGLVAASALNAVAQLKIADILADHPQTISELATKTGTHADSLCRVLRLLCSIGIFEEVAEQKFANNVASEAMRCDVPNSQRDLILFLTDKLHFQAYTDMVPTIRDGKTAVEHIWGKGVFEVLAADKDAQRRFDNAMTNISQRSVSAILAAYDFSQFGTLVDVAGGHGLLLTAILEKHKNLKGILFDLPDVVTGAAERIKSLGLSDRCQMVGGDFFQSVPTGDAIIMKHIIHDWDDEKAIAILVNCRKALSAKGVGKILLVELLLAGRNESHVSKSMDVEMMMLPGGRERTEEEYDRLFERAGFKMERIIPARIQGIIEAKLA